MTTSTPASTLSHGSRLSLTAALFSSRNRRGRTWGKDVLDKEQLSVGTDGFRKEGGTGIVRRREDRYLVPRSDSS